MINNIRKHYTTFENKSLIVTLPAITDAIIIERRRDWRLSRKTGDA